MRRIVTAISVILLPVVAGNINAQITSNEGYNTETAKIKSLSMPLGFTENRGQFDNKTLFKAKTGGATFYFSNRQVTYLFVRDTNELTEDGESAFYENRRPRFKNESMIIKAQFIGANPDPEVVGHDRLSHKSNYFYGNDPSKWRTNVPEYSAIIYKDIYPGIDLKYYGDGRLMKYDFIVAPGADLSKIQLYYEGIDNLEISGEGNLEIKTPFGMVYENAPYAYQEICGEISEIEASYKLFDNSQFGFEVADYNPAYPLFIDPELLYSTYLGGSETDRGFDIAVDTDGSIYVTGMAISPDFPVVNAYQSNNAGEGDIFITKFAPDGQSLIFSTFLGGNDSDIATSIDIDSDGNIFVTGRTYSPDFPTMNPYQTDQPEIDAFIIMLSSQGDSLIFSSYLGGNDDDLGSDIEVDSSGSFYVAGITTSPDFPVLNPYQTYQGYDDAFITKFAPGGDSLIYSSFLGGGGDDQATGLALDDSNCAYITGHTGSSDFPVLNPFQPIRQGSLDIFITKISPDGNSLIYSTYLGGSEVDYGHDIAVDDSGNSYVTGYTYSSDFPVVYPFQSILRYRDAILSKLNAEGDSLIFSTFLGGDSWEKGYAIALDNDRNIFLTGLTRSRNFPAFNAYQGRVGGRIYEFGRDDAFVIKIAYWGSSLAYGTYLGGTGYDYANGIAVDDSGRVYIVGQTPSTDFPILNQFQMDQDGEDAFVAKFNYSPLPIEYCENCVTGIVNNIEAAPLENVFVEVLNTGAYDYTNSQGGYSLENLTPGTYQISLSHSDYVDTIISDIAVESGRLTNLDVKMLGNCAIRGVVVDTNSIPIEDAYIIEPYFRFDDSTDAGGNFFLSGFAPDSSYEFQLTHRDHYYQTFYDISVGVNETLQLDTIYMVPLPIKMLVWFGNLDGSPIETLVGDTFYVDVYMQNVFEEEYVGYMHVPLGSDDQYVVDHLSQTEGQWYYPLTNWDFVYFLDPNTMDSGWTNQSFQAFCNGGGPDPPFYSEIPVKVCTFALRAASDSSLLGDTVDCFIEGFHPANHWMIIGSIDGVEILRHELFISPLAFVELLSCHYTTGDVNNSGDYTGLDITYGVNYLKGGDPPLYECECTRDNTWYVSGDVNGSCSYNGLDITYGVNYFKGIGPNPIPCPDCPPSE